MDIQIVIAAGIIAIALVIIIKWRIGTPYGKIRPSRDITDAYQSFRVDQNRIYYISGSDIYPNAIIGINREWTLGSDLWKKRDLTSQSLKALVQNMQARAAEENSMLHGFDILDNKGRKIGDWFSVTGIITTVEVTGEKSVVVYTPPLDTHRQS